MDLAKPKADLQLVHFPAVYFFKEFIQEYLGNSCPVIDGSGTKGRYSHNLQGDQHSYYSTVFSSSWSFHRISRCFEFYYNICIQCFQLSVVKSKPEITITANQRKINVTRNQKEVMLSTLTGNRPRYRVLSFHNARDTCQNARDTYMQPCRSGSAKEIG